MLLLAIEDAADIPDGRNVPENKIRNQREAIRWFDNAGQRFRQVCDMIGVDPKVVREKWRSGEIMKILDERKNRETPVLRAIHQNPPCTINKIVRTVSNASPNTIVPMMADFTKRGLIVSAKLGNTQAYTLTVVGVAHLKDANNQRGEVI